MVTMQMLQFDCWYAQLQKDDAIMLVNLGQPSLRDAHTVCTGWIQLTVLGIGAVQSDRCVEQIYQQPQRMSAKIESSH